MRKIIPPIFFMLLLSAHISFAQKLTVRDPQPVELTETDIARLDDFDGRVATVFHIGLGMNMTQVYQAVSKQKNLRLEIDPMSNRRLYLYEKSNDSNKLLGYLKWLPKDSGLNQIVLYPAITPHLKGLTCTLLSNSCTDPESEVYKNFLGQPSDEDVVIDVPSIDLKTIRYYYPRHGLMIEVMKDGDKVSYNLILYAFRG
jgi:hypothetical protein